MKYYRITGGPLSTNTYIMYVGDTGFIVDPGIRLADITSALKQLGVTNVCFVIATHGHFDHVFYAGRLCRLLDVGLYMHELDVDLTSRHREVAERYYGDVYEEPGDVMRVYDGMTVKPVKGFEVRVIHTPGHTQGSICVLTGGFLISGDTLFKGTVGRTDFPESSTSKMRSSLKKLVELPGDLVVLPGHGDVTTLNREKYSNPYVRGLLNT
ncbi:MAG: MBL fold metallo-hydrolase [Zestosphaera sp.]